MSSLKHSLQIVALSFAVAIPVYVSGHPAPNVQAQGQESLNDVWRRSAEGVIEIDTLKLKPTAYAAFDLNGSKLNEILRSAPREFTADARRRTVIIPLPLPGGGVGRFRLEESPIIAPKLASRFPWLKSYSVRGIDDRTATGRFEVTPEGFHAMIISAAGTFAIDRGSRKDSRHHISYFKSSLPRDPSGFVCYGTRVKGIRPRPLPTPTPTPPPTTKTHHAMPSAAGDSDLRIYRIAVAASSEYVDAIHQWNPNGDPLNQAISAIHRTINRVNVIYEAELAVRLELIGDEASLIYVNARDDPYAGLPTNDQLLETNQSNIDNVVGYDKYDVGHLFLTHGGGVSDQPSVCNDWYKAEGLTGRKDPQGDLFDVDYVAHELGHQFGASHSFNGTTAGCRFRNADTAYEPGSGSTIMAYSSGSRICGDENVQNHSDDYFHAISLREISAFITNTNTQMGDTCAQKVAGHNLARPVVIGPGDFVIPKGTPFTLTIKMGRDDDGDALVYNWEEFDLGDPDPPKPSDPGDVNKIRPLFRSRRWPTLSRTFPQLIDLLKKPPAGTYTAETLPMNNRTMVFRATVRDQRGRYGYDDSHIKVVSTHLVQRPTRPPRHFIRVFGPFVITRPSQAESWRSGSKHTVRWNVANTNRAPIGCNSVRISLLIRGDEDHPRILVSSTPNDGAQSVFISSLIPRGSARIKVEALGNIFFNVADADVQIVGP